MDDRRRRQLTVIKHLWVGLLFVAVWLIFPYARAQSVVPLGQLWLVLGLAAAYAALRTTLALWAPAVIPYDHAFLFIDVILIGTAVYLTGGIESDFFLAYFIPIAAAGLTFRVRHTFAVVGLVALSHLTATWSDHLLPDYVYRVMTRTFFFALSGSVASFVARQESFHRQEQARLREELAVAQERNRIAREIHDGIGHALVRAILRLEICGRLLGKDNDQVAEILTEEKEALRQTLNETRELVHHLRPASSDFQPLSNALTQLLRRFASATGLKTNLDISADFPSLPPSTELTILRVAQEALTNVAKHAHCQDVSIRLSREGGAARCTISDDGCGFDSATQVQDLTGSGLHLMRERIEGIGGRIEIDSSVGCGVTVRITVPIE